MPAPDPLLFYACLEQKSMRKKISWGAFAALLVLLATELLYGRSWLLDVGMVAAACVEIVCCAVYLVNK